ncbi:hypothetical protein EXE58_07745 [Nocardioides seonyuensis]|uniref:histidine kinase n=1 Tax=Nocardioides seonyuensis TaxID=2518371 RepID=A0A4P7IDV3_9ACTN|nr:ATP-binding protein [Nocardioides seonyuensis]QBX55356.1 hypothetical protein EXE58_07745 [Nocardioides seonyuensis]
MTVLSGWSTLEPSLQRILRWNLTAMTVSLAILVLVYSGGYRHGSVRNDIFALAASVVVMLSTLLVAKRWGPGITVLGLTVAATLFSVAATWASPYLSPLCVMIMLLPLLVAVNHLSRRWINGLMVHAVLGGAAVAALAEWRRDAMPTDTWLVGAVVIGTFMPSASLIVVFLVRDTFHRLNSQSEQLRESRRRVGEVADAARRSMERDLHDGAQQRLLAMSVTIERARKAVAAGQTEDAAVLISQLADDNHETTRELRELARGIYPPLLAERGLVAALQSAARRAALPVTLHADDFERPPMAVENAAYFCILEALTNAIKHSSATEVVITLRADPGLEFFVADDGRGFDPAAVSTPNGLLGMEARMEAVQGVLHVMSAPGRGTTLHGRFPADLDA